jgi:DedD protein
MVLVALFAIIVPTVLDFSRDERSGMKGMEIPPGPDAMQMEVLPLDEWAQKSDPGISPQEAGAAGEAVESTAPPEPAPDLTETAPATVAKVVPKAVPAATPGEQKPITTPDLKVQSPAAPTPVLAPKAEAAAGGGGWVVQVASLTVEAKAVELRDRLRQGGYPAFVEPGKGGNGVIYRVKAGPVQQRGEADELKQRIKQSSNLDGLVMQNQ